jgi:vacuolar-type H+-ATPase subunit C/Vma6
MTMWVHTFIFFDKKKLQTLTQNIHEKFVVHNIKALSICRASKRNFPKRNKTALGSQGQAETSLKIEDLRSNKTTGKLS